MANTSSAPVGAPSSSLVANASQAAVGVPVPALQRLRIMDEDQWEEFILEWVDSLRDVYTDVHRCGGSRDLGRDVIGFKAGVKPQGRWDNYQCKHYAGLLSVADVVAEIGKLLYHASQGEFSLPEKYYFVSPRGPSTSLLKVLQKGKLKEELVNRWDKECRNSIVKGKPIDLATVQSTIDAFDFSRVEVLSPLRLIEGHQKTKYHIMRFGGGLPSRAMPSAAPAAVQENEHVYIRKLLDAYEDEGKSPCAGVDALKDKPEFAQHLDRSREQFFSAESLRTFSRDSVPPNTFENLQSEVFDGVQEIYYDSSHTSGYQRVLKTVAKARDIAITGNPLVGVMYSNDRAGICHQLANDDKMTWVRNMEKKQS